METVGPPDTGADDPSTGDEVGAEVPRPEERVGTQEDPRAEFERSRRRERKEMDEHEVKVRGTILRDFLEVADNLERAIASWKEGGKQDPRSMQDGIDLVLRLFRSKLERYSVTAIAAKGKPFDPHVHHAVSQSPSTEATPGTVLHEVQKGYRMDGRLLRPAIVVVASAPETVPETASEASTSNEGQGTGGEATSDWSGYQRNRR